MDTSSWTESQKRDWFASATDPIYCHSSANNAHALAITRWLTDNGWDEYFLDLEPTKGLTPGQRWQEALRTAADRCEVVLFLISPAWRDSRWCLAESLLAKQLGKKIFGVLIEPVSLDTSARIS